MYRIHNFVNYIFLITSHFNLKKNIMYSSVFYLFVSYTNTDVFSLCRVPIYVVNGCVIM